MLHSQLEDLFRSVLGNQSLVITDEMNSNEIAEWDSVTHINLMFSIEQTFGVQFNGNELAEMKNIGELKAYLVNKGCGDSQDWHVPPRVPK